MRSCWLLTLPLVVFAVSCTPNSVPDSGCVPSSCAALGANCGMVGDGCGGALFCGDCSAGQTCGAGGANKCGTTACTPSTCASQNIECGPAGDGCGGSLTCGTCNADAGLSCGAGGTPGRCGSIDAGACVPLSCAQLDAGCGSQMDGCGSSIDCGGCDGGLSCGGGGVMNQCGAPPCVPTTCLAEGKNCGEISDGCNAMLGCGSCGANEACGVVTPNVCSCVPTSCTALDAGCGTQDDGCGGTLNCGGCDAGTSCGGGGVPHQCGAPCVPTTCAQQGKNCGPINDGCGTVIQCGTCSGSQVCGAITPNVCAVPTPDAGASSCTNLCLRQVTCGGSVTTTLTGTVYAPNGVDPIFNALVYVPNATVQPFSLGVSCDQCGAAVSGSPLVMASTGANGRFTLTNVPTGSNVPLVIQVGRWRRQVTIPSVTACATATVPASLTRLPRIRAEGDIPAIAISTGDTDPLECVLRKIGIDDTEFGAQGSTARVHLYRANGARPNSAMPADFDRSALFGAGSANRLGAYDLVLFACEGTGIPEESVSAKTAVRDYLSAGGRVMATHSSYSWLYNFAPFSGTANWNVGRPVPPSPAAAQVDITFPKGVAFSQWLDVVGASTSLGSNTIPLSNSTHDVDGVIAPTQRWLSLNNPNAMGAASVQWLTFNTPVGQLPSNQCGRVMYASVHVSSAFGGSSNGVIFPAECTAGAMTPQERAFEFALFDSTACVQSDSLAPIPPPACSPATCASLGKNCGQIGDGCGGILNCGACTSPATCGGGGAPNVCGSSCTLRSCGAALSNCGTAADGCGGSLSCGPCGAPSSCGGSGTNNICGVPVCTAKSCADLNANCGTIGNGCGGTINCGSCASGEVCGGGGASRCGTGACSPRTCMQLLANCGLQSDGCGGTIVCGNCPTGQSCGGGGVPNQCGSISCTPRTCAQANANCGPVPNGCGGVLDCGTCTAPQRCGGGGVPSQCGGNCTPRTCGSIGASCGLHDNGCGGTLSCGTCAAGQQCQGSPSQCVTSTSCTPQTCGSGACGSVSDGCGGLLNCGPCDGGGGCVPLACAQVAQSRSTVACNSASPSPSSCLCGPIADGCGGLLDCGGCRSGQVCGATNPSICN